MDQHDLPALPDLHSYIAVRQYGPRPSGVSVILEHTIRKTLILAKRMPCDSSEYGRFLDWISVASGIASELLPGFAGAGRQDDDLLILRNYVEGESLEDFLEAGGLFLPDDCLLLASRMAEFLRLTHEAHLHHGRLKPSNIIISPSGMPVLTGIHVPYMRFRDLSVTRTGFRIESPKYLSPEHFGSQRTVDIRSSIFSLGTVLYRITTGNEPFPGDTVAEIRDKILQIPPAEPNRISSEISPSFSYVIMKMLQKVPEERYQTPDELLSDLEGIRRGQDIVAREPVRQAAAQASRGKARIDPLLVKLLAVFCAVVVIGTAFLFMTKDSTVITPPAVNARIHTPGASPRPIPGRPAPVSQDAAQQALARALESSEADPLKGIEALDRVIRDYPNASPVVVRAIQEKAKLAAIASRTSSKEKTEVDASAAALVQRDRFAEAMALYTRLSAARQDNRNLAEQAQLASLSVKAQAEKRFASLKAQAEKHIAGKRFDDAARVYELVRDSFGIAEYVDAAKQQLAVLEPLAKADREKRQAEQKNSERTAFLQLILPAEQKARLWQFAQAATECERLAAGAKGNATLDQLNRQKREYVLLAQLKARIVEMINSANAPAALASLKIGKEEGNLSAANEDGITIAVGKAQVNQRWHFVQPALIEALTIRSLRENAAGDHAAAAILLLRCGRVALAEQEFMVAEKLGADVSSMRRSAPSEIRNYDNNEKAAEDLISRVQGLIQEKRWADSLADLATLKEDFGRTTYAVQTRADEIDRWLALCRTGNTLEVFARKLKQGSAIDLLRETADGQWQVAGGKWGLAEGNVLRGENADKREAQRLLAVDHPPQYLFKGSFRIVSGSGILIRVAAAGQTGCDFMVDADNPKNVGLWLSQAGKVTRTVLKEVKYEPGKWYEFRAAVRPNAITVRCGDAKFDMTGEFPAQPPTVLGFVVRRESTAEFRDAVLQSLKRQ